MRSIIRSKYYGIIRAFTVALAFLLQIVTMCFMASYLMKGFFELYFVLEVISVLTVFALVNDEESYKQGWILIILMLPIAGLFLYFMWGRKRENSVYYQRFRELETDTQRHLIKDEQVTLDMQKEHPNKAQISRYLLKSGYPIYKGTQVSYYKVGEDMIDAMLEDLKNAKKFIFMEYFIVSEGKVWDQILEILTEKVRQGVEVKLLFDDFGTLRINTHAFRKDMQSRGIKVRVFNPIHQDVVRLTFNYRNHQKIMIIDGDIGYTGGINIADEYANHIVRFGHWKDSGVRLVGDGVWSLTCFFLQMWRSVRRAEVLDYEQYRPTISVKETGYVQPFMGGPHRNPTNPIEGAYTRMITKARDYIYITTPYLVLDQKMLEDLRSAAESDVDVRIIVPAIYDKWYVYMVNVSNYGKLIEAGVRIYEYKPGFIHAKNVIADDECAICGTINTDYRSFYHHYECGVFMSDLDVVAQMKEDFNDTLEQCDEISYEKWKGRPYHQKVVQSALKLLSPML